MNKHSKSITKKLMVAIIIPAILMFIILSALVLTNVKKNMNSQSDDIMKESSVGISREVQNFFTKYTSTADTCSVDKKIIDYLNGVKPGKKFKDTKKYSEMNKHLKAVADLDTENIMNSWIVDIDSNQMMNSNGKISDSSYDVTQRAWYSSVTSSDKAVISEPYEDSQTKEMVISVVAPVYKNSNLLGVYGIDITVEHLNDLLSKQKVGESGYFTFITEQGTILYTPNSEYLLKNINEVPISDEVKEMLSKDKEGNVSYDLGNKTEHGYVSEVGNTSWTGISAISDDEYNETYNHLKVLLITIIVGMLILLAVTILVSSKTVVKPLRKLAEIANKVADGNLNVNMDVDTQDETGLVAEAFDKTIVRLKKYMVYIDELSDLLNQIGDGDLNIEFKQDYQGEFAVLKESLLNATNNFNDIITEFDVAADQVASGSNQVSAGAQALSQGTTEQASSIEELSSAVNEIAAQVKGAAEGAEEAKIISNDANTATQHSQEEMKKMMTAMDQISNYSAEIGKIIKSIDDIAFQTNILSLNAAVEAARAGNAGKGFAVVAEEVRNLAGKSADSAKSTADLIESARYAIDNGSKIASETADSLNDVVTGSEKTTKFVQEIVKAVVEESQAIEQVNVGISQISDVVQTNSATAEESAAASEELSGQAQMLKEMVDKFNLMGDSSSTKNDFESKTTEKEESENSSYKDISSNSSNYHQQPTKFIDL